MTHEISTEYCNGPGSYMRALCSCGWRTGIGKPGWAFQEADKHKASTNEEQIIKLKAKIKALKAVLEFHFEAGDLELHEDDCESDVNGGECDCPAKDAFNDAMREDD